MSTHVMVDLETMGNSNNAAIISIGACKFDPLGSRIGEKFHLVVDMASCVAAGLTLDASTVTWWMQQSEQARKVFATDRKYDLLMALVEFNKWFGKESMPLWGNGATFDNVILRSAYRAVKMDPPWQYWDDRCYRTMKNMAPSVKMEKLGVAHNALDDAVNQAVHLQAIFKQLGVK